MAQDKYWDGTKWVPISASYEEFTTHKADDVAHNRYGVATGTNTLVVTLSPAPTALTAGVSLRFKNTTVNTGAVTLNINGRGAKPIVKNGSVALTAGNLKAGGVYTVVYDGTSFILQGEGGDIQKASGIITSASTNTNIENHVGTYTSTPHINFDMSNLPFIPSVITFTASTKNIVDTMGTWFYDNFYEASGNFANSSLGTSSFRVPFINGVVRIPTYLASRSLSWVAYRREDI